MTGAAAQPRQLLSAELDSLSMPPFGARTNGLTALSWVPLVDVTPALAGPLLTALYEHGIPACTRAPNARLGGRRRSRVQRVWVDVVDRARAEDITRHVVLQDSPSTRVVSRRDGGLKPSQRGQ